MLAGGFDTGRSAYNNCTHPPGTSAQPTFPVSRIAVANNSYTLCELTPPFLTQIKVLGSYTIPRVDTQLIATLQNLPGPQILATWAAPSAAIAPSLGRPLAGNAASSPVQLLPPATYFGDRLNQVDFRVSKSFGLTRGGRVQVSRFLQRAECKPRDPGERHLRATVAHADQHSGGSAGEIRRTAGVLRCRAMTGSHNLFSLIWSRTSAAMLLRVVANPTADDDETHDQPRNSRRPRTTVNRIDTFRGPDVGCVSLSVFDERVADAVMGGPVRV